MKSRTLLVNSCDFCGYLTLGPRYTTSTTFQKLFLVVFNRSLCYGTVADVDMSSNFIINNTKTFRQQFCYIMMRTRNNSPSNLGNFCLTGSVRIGKRDARGAMPNESGPFARLAGLDNFGPLDGGQLWP